MMNMSGKHRDVPPISHFKNELDVLKNWQTTRRAIRRQRSALHSCEVCLSCKITYLKIKPSQGSLPPATE